MGCKCNKNKEEFLKKLSEAKLSTNIAPGVPLSSTSPEVQNNPKLKEYLEKIERIQRRAERIRKREIRIQRRKLREEQQRIAEQAVIDKRNSVQQKSAGQQTV